MRGSAVLGVVVSGLLASCGGSSSGDIDGSSEIERRSEHGEGSWADIDPCSLLSSDALAAAGVEDTDGEPEPPPDPPPGAPTNHGPSCRWGEGFGGTASSVEVFLWIPPFLDLFDQYRELEVAGRPAYTADEADNTISCMVDVDNGDYFIHIELEKASGDGALACEVATSLASAAVSSVDS